MPSIKERLDLRAVGALVEISANTTEPTHQQRALSNHCYINPRKPERMMTTLLQNPNYVTT
jgi:hypothetical protein